MNRHAPPTVSQRVHHYTVRIYYEDTDAGGVVYHANYLRLAERARTEALRDLGVPHAEMVAQAGLMFMVRRVKVDYLAPARVDEVLTFATRAVAIRAASVDISQVVMRGGAGHEGAPIAVLDVRLACVRLSDGRPARIPPRWLGALSELKES